MKDGLRGCGSSTGMICLIVPGRAENTATRSARNTASPRLCVTKTMVLFDRDSSTEKVFAEHHACLLVERAKRLVHQQNVSLQAERTGKRGALAHAARQLGRIMPGEVEETDSLQCTAGARTALGLGDALERHPKHDVFKHRIPWKQRAFLKHESEVARHRPAHRRARDRDRAARRRK